MTGPTQTPAPEISRADLHHLAAWFSGRYASAETTVALRDWYGTHPSTPRSLASFLRPDRARALARCLECIESWHHVHSIVDTNDKIVEVDPTTWAETSPAERWNRQDILRPLTAITEDARFEALVQFLQFLSSDPVLNWISRITKTTVQRFPTCEVTRYRQCDYIAEHADTHDNRAIGLNLYLDATWEPSYGGELLYRNERGEKHIVEPRYNSVGIFPVREGCTHQVLETRHATPSRHTISLAYRPA